MNHNETFSGQTAIVCGASQGIGLAVSRILAEKGARVIGVARNLERLKFAFSQLPNPAVHKCFSSTSIDDAYMSRRVSNSTGKVDA
jgi:NAD(P)-dependent dehydrogenase (short-subunit alcohol dehydrogenase family)